MQIFINQWIWNYGGRIDEISGMNLNLRNYSNSSQFLNLQASEFQLPHPLKDALA